mmetsp:Transcript_9806/g.23998  ORF Transcript_9806/g.23998 Transcript_9806/m.23998 type:complete len:342 (+) Transcript_9806:1-1026(+)
MAAKKKELLLLVLSNGLSFGELAATLEMAKSSSKSCGSHRARELYWEAYGKMITKVGGLDGQAFCFLQFWKAPGDDGAVEIVDLTKRQKGLVTGGCDFLGQKMKPPEDKDAPAAKSKHWCVVYSEEEAAKAWEDINHAEACICLAPDGVYAATRYKRVLCKGLSGPLKSLKDVQTLVSELQPDKPLRSISFAGNDPPSVNAYNTFVAGSASAAVAPNLPKEIGYCSGTTPGEVYDYFLKRRSASTIMEAEKLISQMLTDVKKGEIPLVVTGKKEAATAVKNSLMKKVYVHESMGKFIDFVRADGSVELVVITGNLEEMGQFGQFGGLVFELFYRADLSAFG